MRDDAADIELQAGAYRLALRPSLGGSVVGFVYDGVPLMRPMTGSTILDVACFPMLPYVNRIANGRFVFEGRSIHIPPNFPGREHPHPLHGDGWRSAWRVADRGAATAMLTLRYDEGGWPWRYVAEQQFELTAGGLIVSLTLRNVSDRPMPGAIGLHPYFPLTPGATYHGLHRGEWATDPHGLPVSLDRRSTAIDWWAGRPVGERSVDTVYADRSGDLSIGWPEHALRLDIRPDAIFDHTALFVQPEAAFFCVEPMSEPTDALNRRAGALRVVAPGDAIGGAIVFSAGRTRRRRHVQARLLP